MAEPNTVAFRIDKKLIREQGQLWVKALGVNTVIVANDSASEDPIQQTLMKVAVPKTITMRFFSTRHTCDVTMKASPKQTILIACKTIGDTLRLVADGVSVKGIDAGNIHHAPGKEDVSKYIALGEDDKAALRKMRDQHGITFNTKTAASGDDRAAKVDLSKYL